ncbi:LADA_0D05512g1_1 [Lachancea dasiensis]|uniref:Pre-mRNA-splicing factor CWC21 n=1 Tax=Lachancea dasiensis TaxID=1072105 RepID=A0A1G4J5H4_9SACH|nr:LADA_0D05512g1_1 [Lachancea dasiensis]
MSFNGIGLKSAKGSSTSGHVQQSLVSSQDRKNAKDYLNRVEKTKALRPKASKNKPNRKDESILKHLSRRELELRVSEYRDNLEDMQELDKAEIDAKCQEYREQLAAEREVEEKDEKLRTAYVSRKRRTAKDEGSEDNQQRE